MPNLFNYMGYVVFFWSNENFEPIHVHICKGKPTSNATKVWITKNGDCILANNNSMIPAKDLNHLLGSIASNHFFIVSKWKEIYQVEDVKFYC